MKPARRNPLQQREKLLALGFGGVVLVWWLIMPLVRSVVLDPLTQRKAELAGLTSSRDEKQTQQLLVRRAGSGLSEFRARSLPPDEIAAQQLYQSWLTDLAYAVGFEDLKVSPDTRTKKGDVYTSVKVSITGEATLEQLSRFLHEFYRTDLLHSIPRIDLTSGGTTPRSPITVTLVAEGLSLRDAEPRDRLFPTASLANAVERGDKSVTVDAPAGFPTEGEFRVRVGKEVLLVRGVDGAQWSVQRGADGTQAESHAGGTRVEFLPLHPAHANKTLEDYRRLLAASPFALPVPPREYKPKLEVPDETVVIRGQSLKLSAKASDFNPTFGDPLFRLEGSVPPGLTIDAKTGELTWTPAADQKASKYRVTVVATQDAANPPKLTQSVEIALREPNSPPRLQAVPDKTLYVGQSIAFAVQATDPDQAAGQKVTYKLGDGAPAGATIKADTGEFRWESDLTQKAGEVEVKIVATDSGDPPLEDTRSVKVSVKDDAARFTTLVGCVGDDTNREAWLYNQLERKQTVLREGSSFEIADVSGVVLAIDAEEVVLRSGEAKWRLKLGRNLRSLERLAAPDEKVAAERKEG